MFSYRGKFDNRTHVCSVIEVICSVIEVFGYQKCRFAVSITERSVIEVLVYLNTIVSQFHTCRLGTLAKLNIILTHIVVTVFRQTPACFHISKTPQLFGKFAVKLLDEWSIVECEHNIIINTKVRHFITNTYTHLFQYRSVTSDACSQSLSLGEYFFALRVFVFVRLFGHYLYTQQLQLLAVFMIAILIRPQSFLFGLIRS